MSIFDNHSAFNNFVVRNGFSEKSAGNSPSLYIAYIQIKNLLLSAYKENKNEIYSKIKGRKKKSTSMIILDETQLDILMDEYISKIESYSLIRMQEYKDKALLEGYYDTIIKGLYKMTK